MITTVFFSNTEDSSLNVRAVRVDFIDLLSSGSQYFLPYVISHPHWITAVGISHFAVHNVRRIRINKIDGSYHQYTMTDRDD